MNEPKSHFTAAELCCTHCGKGTLNPSTLERLETARRLADAPMKVNSAFRCPQHNAELVALGKGSADSAHMAGKAVDIAVHNSAERYRFTAAFMAAGFVRIGVGDTFLHVDDDETKPQHTIWMY